MYPNRCDVTNLKVVRRSSYDDKAERAKHITAWGPRARSKAPMGSRSKAPVEGPRGRASGSSGILQHCKRVGSPYGPEKNLGFYTNMFYDRYSDAIVDL